jgi:Peptidase S46
VVGYPTGLPEKLAAGAKVHALTPYFFTSNLDAFAGNSGSPVLDARTNEVVGVVVRGNRDYVLRGQCAVPLVLPNSYVTTHSTLSSAFAPFLPQH